MTYPACNMKSARLRRGRALQTRTKREPLEAYACAGVASRTIQMPVRSCTWVWMRDSSPV